MGDPNYLYYKGQEILLDFTPAFTVMKTAKLRCLITAYLLALLNPNPVVAASIDGAEPAVLEEVVVTGIRGANRAVIAVKQAAQQIMDTLAADDIGKFPDINIADSFRRLPGVNTLFDSDEGQFVVVRGIDPDLNFVTIDGMVVASQDDEGGRRVNLEVIPGTAVNRLDVYKTQTPDLDGNAIGGNINMVTKSAYDTGDLFFTAELFISHYSLDDVPDDRDDGLGGRAGFTFSNTFGVEDRFGLVLSASFNRKKRDEQKTSNDTYRYDNALDTPVNKQIRTLQYTNSWDRYGGSAKFELRPNDQLHLFFNNYYYTQEEEEHRNFVYLEESGDEVLNLREYSGEITAARNTQRYSYRPTDRENRGHHVSVEYYLNDRHKLDVDLAYSQSVYDRPFDDFRFRTEEVTQLGYRYDMTGTFTTLILNDPDYIVDPTHYTFDKGSFRHERQEEKVKEFKVDYSYNMEGDALGWGVKTGAKYRDSRRAYDWDEWEYRLASGAGDLTLTDFYSSVDYRPDHYDYPIFIIDHNAFNAYYAANRSDFGFDVNEGQEADSIKWSTEDDYQFKETVSAGYVMARYATDTFQLITGVRYEQTNVQTAAFSFNENDGSFTPNTNRGDFTDVLPSMNMSYSISAQTKLRAAFSQSIGRANPGDTSARQNVSVEDNGDRIIQRGNPNLKPRQSNNVDLSVEYYFDAGDGLFSVAIFRKDIKDLIFDATTASTDAEGFETTIISQQNANNADINGLELALIKNSFDFLPAPFHQLGMAVNITFIDAQMTYEDSGGKTVTLDHLLEQPDFLANLSLFYGSEKGELRVAYHYTDTYSDGLRTDGKTREERLWTSYGQVDVHARYQLTEHTLLQANSRNLTDKHRTRVTGDKGSLFSENVVFGRSFWLGLSYTF